VPAEIVVQSGHSEGTDVLSFSPDGKIIASGSSDGTIKLWTAERLLLLRTLRDRSGAVGAVAFTNDGRLVAGYRSGTLIAWDIATGRKLRELKLHSGWVKALAVHSGDRVLSAAQDGTVRMWDLSDGSVATVHRRKKTHYSQLALAADGRSYAVVADDGTVTIGHLEHGNARIVKHLTRVRSIGWSQHGTLLVARWTGDLLGWNTLKGQVSWRAPAAPASIGAAPLFSSDGRHAILGDNDGKLIIVNLTDQTRSEQHAHSDFISALAFDARGSWIVTAGNDDVMRVWSAGAREKLAEVSVRPQAVEAVAANQRSHLLVSGDLQGVLAVWDLRGGEKLRSLRFAPDWVTELTVSISLDGAVASTSARQQGADMTTSVWPLRDGTAAIVGAREWTSIGAMDPTGSMLVTFGRTITFWDVNTHQRMREAPGSVKSMLQPFYPTDLRLQLRELITA